MEKSFILVVTFTTCCLMIAVVKAHVDYCKFSCNGEVHTMCKYNKNGTTACTNVVRSGLNKDEKQKIVDLHNKLRQFVASGAEKRGKPGPQPAAKNMPNLTWDKELEFIAQRWADQCNYDHDCGNVERFEVGQNLAESESSQNDTNLEELVLTWYDEVDSYNGKTVSSFIEGENKDGEDIGHYTQMIWAKTTKIGCGFVSYKRDGNFVNYLVCNYGEAGNSVSEPVYQR